MNAVDRRTTARILKVNHAGEYAAIRIYRARAWVARKLYPNVVDFLQETLQHEIEHCFLFLNAIRGRSAGLRQRCPPAFLTWSIDHTG